MAADGIFTNMMKHVGFDLLYINDDEQFGFKGVIQPLRYKNKVYLSGIPTEIGYDSLKRYLLICELALPVDEMDGNRKKLVFDSYSYRVDYCEKVYFKGEPAYYWAIVHKGEEYETDGTDD